jgi:hypothetical protein
MAFSLGNTLYHANENAVHTLNQATGAATWVADFVSPRPANDSPRINGMDYYRGPGILYAALNNGTGGDHENYLSILDTATGEVSIIGQTVDGLDAIAVGGLICNGPCVAVEVNGVVRIMDSVTRRDTNVYQTARNNCIAAGGDMANFDESYVWATTVWMTNSSDIAYYSYENEAFCDSYDPWGAPNTCCGKWNDGFGWHDLYGCSCHQCGTDQWDTFSTGSNGGYVCVDRH